MKGSKHYTDYTGAGIYALVNTDDGIAYIGKSQNISNRWATHRSNFKRKADCAPFYKNDINRFHFVILKKMSKEAFEEYGMMEECAFRRYFEEKGIQLYNREKYESSEYILNLLVFNAGRNTYSAFIDNLGFNPYMLVYTNRKKTKEQVRKTGS